MRRSITGALLAVAACSRVEPPGAEREPVQVRLVGPGGRWEEHQKPASSSASREREALGTLSDNLPFEPDGTRVASIAWRTWIYTDTGPKRTRYGYLRAGAVVDARGPAIKNAGCDGGWYRVNPRGFVCLGKGATLEFNDHPVVKASRVRPQRGQGLPYAYVMAGEEPPFLYFRAPRKEEMVRIEGEGLEQRIASWRAREASRGTLELLGELSAPPEYALAGLAKPYGVKQGLHFSAHAGRSAPDSGFALARAYEWEGRVFGLTTELDLIALDRTRIVKPSAFHGVELEDGEDLPVAVVDTLEVRKFSISGTQIEKSGRYLRREWIKLTGKLGTGPLTLHETRDGGWVSREGLRVLEPRESFPSFATGTRKWIDVSIRDQTLVAYSGRKAVYATLVSTGRGGLGDPEKTFATIRGTFMVHSKHVSATMDGDEDDHADSYALKDVPFVQYFHNGFALHGTYWHDEFGKVRSHGCVNLAPVDAAWLFEWTDPAVPSDWHGALNLERGTVVYVHP